MDTLFSFHHIYHDLLAQLMGEHVPIEVNKRTGEKVRILAGGHSFKLDLSPGRLPVTGTRRLYPRSAAAEVAWFLSGSRDVTWLQKYAPLWDKFVEDDGRTIDAAYGYRWRHHFGRDQVGAAYWALKADPSNRRVLVSAWDPGYDGLGAEGQKNVPCPACFTLSVVDGRLHSTLLIRSSDVFVGLPYDVMGHALMMDCFAESLGYDLGVMQVSIGHPHLYEPHWEMAETCLDDVEPVLSSPRLPNWTLNQVEADPDEYVARVLKLSKAVSWPTFNPKPEVVL